MKKIIAILTIIMVFILPFSVTFNEQKAHANIISKPLTITAKKVAKELAQESAVTMAEHILFEKAMNDFLNTDMTDSGYKAVCLDGAKSYENCSPNKRAQIKETLTSSDKATLSNKVEEVLERKTNTSSKWTKFLDWFVPIFLISGLVATFESMMDSDSEGLIDDIAKESLEEAGFLKQLNAVESDNSGTNFNFANYVEDSVTKSFTGDQTNSNYLISFTVKPNKSITFTTIDRKGVENVSTLTGSTNITASIQHTYIPTSANNYTRSTSVVKLTIFQTKSRIHLLPDKILWERNTLLLNEESKAESKAKANQIIAPVVSAPTAPSALNAVMNLYNGVLSVNVETMPDAIVPIEVGTQPGIERIKNPDGTVTTPGIESFKYTYNNTFIYPSPESTTGWKDKATDIDIAVVEDDVVVDGGEPPIDPEAPPAEDDDVNTDKDKDKIKKKSRDWSALLTTRFPFSLPWDFLHLMKFLYAEPMTPQWEIKGTEKVPFNLKMDLKFMEPYAPWFRTFIFLSFVMSVIFLHGRFMGGSK